MKALIILAALCSLNAMACPQLAGSYTCTSNEPTKGPEKAPPFDYEVSQKNNVDLTIYEFPDMTVPADGKGYKIPDNDDLHDAVIKNWCPEEKVFRQGLVGRAFEEKVYFGDIALMSEYTETDAGMTQKVTRIISNHGGIFVKNIEINCVKKK